MRTEPGGVGIVTLRRRFADSASAEFGAGRKVEVARATGTGETKDKCAIEQHAAFLHARGEEGEEIGRMEGWNSGRVGRWMIG